MVFVQLAVDEEGQFTGRTKYVKNSIHHTMSNIWKGMANDGTISEVGSLLWFTLVSL